ncbi:MAG: hypothetical protein GY771_06925 [bacterium]|nr:hypothetical protein [bacterium]
MLSGIIYLSAFSLLMVSALYAVQRDKIKLSLLLSISGFAVLVAYYFGWVMDDAYISLRYAANLANGYGLTFNPGQTPVEGFSNPLWTLIITIPELVGLRGIYPVKVISALFALLNLPAVYLASRRLYGEEKPTAVAAILVCISAPFAVWAGAGMETPLFTLLALLAIYFYLGDRLWITSVFLGLIALTRPEGIVFFPPFFVAAVVSRKTTIKQIAAILLPAVILVGGYLAFRISYFGDILPNTYYAKMGGGFGQALAGILYLARFSAFTALPLWILFGIISFRKAVISRDKYLIVVLIMAYVAFIVSAGFDLPAFRFFANVWPLVALMCAGGFVWLSGKLGTRWRWVFCAAVIGWSAFGAYQLRERNMMGAFSDRVGIRENGAGERSSALAIGRYLKKNAGAGDKLALIDAGLMPYYSGLDVLDVWGLCDKEISIIKHDASRGVISGEEAGKRIRELFFDYDADYVALDVVGQSYEEACELALSGDYASLDAHPQFREINRDPRFAERYRLVDGYPAMDEYSIFLFELKGK